MIITLNKTEQRLAQYIAKRRYEHDRSVNATATIYGNGTPEERELDSVAAEIAFVNITIFGRTWMPNISVLRIAC